MNVNEGQWLVHPLGDDVVLASGGHNTREEGMCLMEAVAFVAGEPHTDTPACACPVIAAFGRRLNDLILDDEMRTRLLKPLVTQLVGSKETRAIELQRAFLAVDWVVRVRTPEWMSLVPDLKAHAIALQGLSKLDSEQACRDALPVLKLAREASWKSFAAAAATAAAAADADAAYYRWRFITIAERRRRLAANAALKDIYEQGIVAEVDVMRQMLALGGEQQPPEAQ